MVTKRIGYTTRKSGTHFDNEFWLSVLSFQLLKTGSEMSLISEIVNIAMHELYVDLQLVKARAQGVFRWPRSRE